MVQSISGGFCVLNQFFTLPNQFKCSINQASCMPQGPFSSRHAIPPLYFGANAMFERIRSSSTESPFGVPFERTWFSYHTGSNRKYSRKSSDLSLTQGCALL